MPHLRRNVVELLARVPQEVRTPQEKAGLPAFAHAKDVAPATTGLILYEPPSRNAPPSSRQKKHGKPIPQSTAEPAPPPCAA